MNSDRVMTLETSAIATAEDRIDTTFAGARIAEPKRGPRLVFSDLDGTLLDRDDYSWGAAQAGLEALAEGGVPLILVTSKTRVEVEALCPHLGVHDPFVFENGGGVFLPKEFDPAHLPNDPSFRVESRGCGRLLSWGGQYAALRRFLSERADRYGLRGFGDLTAEELAEWTGLSLDEAERAQRREFTEPFRFGGESRLASLAEEAISAGYRIVQGGRFHHLQAASATKGRAVRALVHAYSQLWGAMPYSLALGDAENDLPMLMEVDRAVWFGRPDAGPRPGSTAGLRCPSESGPAAWSREVLTFLARPLPGDKHV